MQSIANIFLILFLNTAVLGIADTLFSRKFALSWLPPLHDFSTGFAVFFGLAIYFGFAVNSRLPKSVLVPPLLFLLWGLLNFWPLENLLGSSPWQYMFIVQLLLGLLVLQINLSINKKSRLMVRSQFAGPTFCGRNLLRFVLFNIPLLPLIIVLLGFATVSNLIDEQAAGFIRLKPNGLYMVEKVYQKGEKEIHLSSMIHLGQQSYYDSLSDSLQGQQAILLAEGVSDKDGRLQGEFDYQKIADLLGLASQEQMLIDGRLVTPESLEQLEDRQAGKTDVLLADIDLAEFDARTITLLNALGRYVLNNESFVEGFHEFNQWSEENTTPETNRIVMNDLVQKRNRTVLNFLARALKKYDTVVIPWGALHMPGLETAILHKGFRLRDQQERLSVDFFQLPFQKLWEPEATLSD